MRTSAAYVFAAAALITFGIAGCSSSPTPDEQFVASVRAKAPAAFSGDSDEVVAAAGHAICTRITNGISPKTAITAEIVEAALSPTPATRTARAYAVGAAVAILCPEFGDAFVAVSGG